MIPIEIKIPKENRDYQESIVFGLSLRQCVFSLLAIVPFEDSFPKQTKLYGLMTTKPSESML